MSFLEKAQALVDTPGAREGMLPWLLWNGVVVGFAADRAGTHDDTWPATVAFWTILATIATLLLLVRARRAHDPGLVVHWLACCGVTLALVLVHDDGGTRLCTTAVTLCWMVWVAVRRVRRSAPADVHPPLR